MQENVSSDLKVAVLRRSDVTRENALSFLIMSVRKNRHLEDHLLGKRASRQNLMLFRRTI